MGRKIDYPEFLKSLDKKLEGYFEDYKPYVCCKAGCSSCCEKGDYPISDIELEYLIHGFVSLEQDIKRQVQENFKNIQKGGCCPFLVNNLCSVYQYRPIICRTHGLAYLMKDGRANVPYCVNEGKCYGSVFQDGELLVEPVKENLSTSNLLKDFSEEFVIKNLVEWL